MHLAIFLQRNEAELKAAASGFPLVFVQNRKSDLIVVVLQTYCLS